MDNVTNFAQVPYLSREEQIERKVERMVDKLDREFLSGKFHMTDWEYERRLRLIDEWAKVQLRRK